MARSRAGIVGGAKMGSEILCWRTGEHNGLDECEECPYKNGCEVLIKIVADRSSTDWNGNREDW